MVFRRQTLFVVGAGASAEVGLPVGSALTNEIAEAANFKLDTWGTPENEATDQLLGILRQRSLEPRQLNEWLAALTRIRDGIHLKRSIDSYIDQHVDEPQIAEMGKLLIARRILAAENRSDLATDGRPLDLQRQAIKNSWLDQFAAMLFEGLRLGDIERLSQNIDIVCFNYDRCIEHYLTHALVAAYAVPISTASELVGSLNIIHPYGSLGALSAVPFGADRHDYWGISSNLKTFSESADSAIEAQIEQAVLRAEQYVFLGFSFGRQNMELLSVPGLFMDEGRDAYASGFGLYEQGVMQLSNQIEGIYGHQQRFMPLERSGFTRIEVNTKARQLLDMHWHNIMA